MFKKVLIANRGEIAVRIHRACREMGIATVAVHSEADAGALHVKLANESVCIGGPRPQDSYLSIPAIMAAAEVTDSEAIHPGYGFLAENAKFAHIVQELGFTFIGPEPKHIEVMGDKVEAKKYAKKLGLPLVPGSDGGVEDVAQAIEIANGIGFPVIIKAAAGGGGRGMKVAHSDSALRQAFHVAQAEAQAAFGDGRVYIEKYLQQPRHIEVQVLCDRHGTVQILGERDCSLQRRHQKIIEETPSPAIDDGQREELCSRVRHACQEMGYLGAGTLEFLYEDGEFYFIEMNTRLQVEHPVTEMVTGVDLVREQLRVAAGAKLDGRKTLLTPRGHSIECRINAEDPETFAPSPGKVDEYYAPGGLGVRVDSALYPGYVIPPYYDATVAKLVVHGADRAECVRRLRRALEEFVITGVKTNIPLHRRVVGTNAFMQGEYDIHSLERFTEGGQL